MAESTLISETGLIALAGGIIPAIIWLLFWLQQDKKAPEPRGLIAVSFFAGMIMVILVLPVQKFAGSIFPLIMQAVESLNTSLSLVVPDQRTVEVITWAVIEEVAKYATVFLIAFRSSHFDEPIDAVMYLITAALGFSALENAFYLLSSMAHLSLLQALLDGNLRFIGATILHTVSSAVVGIAIAFTFYAPKFVRRIAVIIGLILATLLHAYFNLSIMDSNGTLNTLTVFSWYWLAIIIIILVLAVIKRFTRINSTTTS